MTILKQISKYYAFNISRQKHGSQRQVNQCITTLKKCSILSYVLGLDQTAQTAKKYGK